MAKRTKLVPLEIGPLPADSINLTLDLELEPGTVMLSINAQKHAARRHPDDYARCLPHVASVVLNPLYIGDDLNNDGIELIARVQAIGSGLLVAVSVERAANGLYDVISFYPVSEQKIAGRLAKGFLFPAQKR
jgi:hypothetical protein